MVFANHDCSHDDLLRHESSRGLRFLKLTTVLMKEKTLQFSVADCMVASSERQPETK